MTGKSHSNESDGRNESEENWIMGENFDADELCGAWLTGVDFDDEDRCGTWKTGAEIE